MLRHLPWARRFGAWIGAALAAFALSIGLALGGAPEALAGLGYVLASAALSFACLAVFLRFARERRPAFDSAFENSLGIYVFHYGIVSWLLFAALGFPLPAIVKWAVLSILAVGLSWGLTAALRRIPGVAKVL